MLRNYLLRSVAMFAAPGEDGNGGDPPVTDAGAGAAAADGGQAGQGDAGGEDGAAAAGEGGGDKGGAAAGDPPAAGAGAQKKEDWRDKELRRKHAQNQEMRRQLDERNTELASLRAIAERTGGAAPTGDDGAAATPAPAAVPPRTTTPPAGQDDVRQQALAQVRFEEAANAADRSGRERYKDDWKAATDNLALIGGFDPDTMNGILATDDPAKVLYELGKNPDRYSEIMALPPARRQTEMVKMGMAAPVVRKEPSSAPPPPEHIGGRPRVEGDALRDDMTDEDWYARRQRQKAARHAARQAGR